MSTVKTTTGKKKRQEQTTPFLRTGMPFIVQWCRNVKDAECPPDTLLCARGRVSSLHSAAITRLSSGRQGEAHPQRDLQKTWSSREPERFLFGSDLIICQPRECVCVCMLLYIYIYIYMWGGHTRRRRRRVLAAWTQTVIISRCAVWGEVIAEYHGFHDQMCLDPDLKFWHSWKRPQALQPTSNHLFNWYSYWDLREDVSRRRTEGRKPPISPTKKGTGIEWLLWTDGSTDTRLHRLCLEVDNGVVSDWDHYSRE